MAGDLIKESVVHPGWTETTPRIRIRAMLVSHHLVRVSDDYSAEQGPGYYEASG